MKRFLCIAALACTAGSAFAADVGVSVDIGLPGGYGRIDIGGYPPPQVINPQPVYIQRGPSGPPPAPLYLHVPPGHAKNWRRHCAEYDACGRPVYFVRDEWVRDVYAPRYREVHRQGPDRRDDRRDDRHDDRRGNDHKDDHRGGDDRGPRGHDDRNDRGPDR